MAVREMDTVIFVIRVLKYRYCCFFLLSLSAVRTDILGIKHVLACASFGHVYMCMCWCLMQFVCTVPFELACVVYSSFNKSHRMRQHSCTHRHRHTLTLAIICSALSVSARTIVNVNVCQKQHMLLYTFQPLPLPPLLLLLHVSNTHRRVPCKQTANNNALLHQISDFQLGAFFIKRKAALAEASAAAATERIKWVHCLLSFVFVPSFVPRLLNLYTHLKYIHKGTCVLCECCCTHVAQRLEHRFREPIFVMYFFLCV